MLGNHREVEHIEEDILLGEDLEEGLHSKEEELVQNFHTKEGQLDLYQIRFMK